LAAVRPRWRRAMADLPPEVSLQPTHR
jgi:hypothetical protein